MPIVRILLILFFVATAYFLRQRSVRSEAARMKISHLQPGPIRHSHLPEELVARVRKLETALAGVYVQSHEKWIEGFQRDTDPASEIAIWEAIAAAYQKFTEKRSLSPVAKKEVLGLLLVRSTQDARGTLAGSRPEHLTQAEAEELLALYSAPPQAILYDKSDS